MHVDVGFCVGFYPAEGGDGKWESAPFGFEVPPCGDQSVEDGVGTGIVDDEDCVAIIVALDECGGVIPIRAGEVRVRGWRGVVFVLDVDGESLRVDIVCVNCIICPSPTTLV